MGTFGSSLIVAGLVSGEGLEELIGRSGEGLEGSEEVIEGSAEEVIEGSP
jgi:hypothetical protein